MRLRLGCDLTYWFPQDTPLIALLNVHHSRFGDLEKPDHLITFPAVPIQSYRDMYGNWCCRLTAPAGEFKMGTDCVIRDPGTPDVFDDGAVQHRVEDLPSEVLTWLLPSRYCDTDTLIGEAVNLFGHTPADGRRVQAICDYVHNHLVFNYKLARPTRTAAEAHAERSGVCRDFTHLAIAFCRAMNIPAMYCSGFISDVNQAPPYASQDFCAWMRVYLGGAWRDYVHNHLVFNYKLARPTRTAAEAHAERSGVCRDFTHLAIAFCRAMNIPAMYCSGFISDVNQAPPYASQDFCAWMRVYLGGAWRDYDPRNNRPMTGRVLCTTGRDAADTPLIHSFGWGALNGFKVWAEEVGGDPAQAQAPEVSIAGNPLR